MLTFNEIPVPATIKTRRLEVFNGTTMLGRIQFRSTWRCYVFEPVFPTVFDSKCLKEIQNYLDAMKAARHGG